MSSCVEAGGTVAAAVMLPVAVAYGAGWLAWQGGKLLIEADRAVDRQILEKKRQLEEAANHRRMTAISAHNQLVDMCSQILSQLETESDTGSMIRLAEVEQLKYELQAICNEYLPEDTVQIESITSLGYLKLDEVIRRQRQIAEITLSDSEAGVYRGLSVADLMDDLRIVIGTMEIHETKGKNVIAADPDVLERTKLNEEFAGVTAEIMEALKTVESLSATYGLTVSENTWFHSCFNGIDMQIEALCRPNISNKELKRGIRRLRGSVDQYNMLAPSIEKDLKRMAALYKVYVDASHALGEKIWSIKSFKDSSEIEERLSYLQKRADRARRCAEIYKRLGLAAYLCYAWDQELKAMGYEVHTREKIIEMARNKPTHAEVGGHKIPFYQWHDEDLTQLYSVSSQCALQVIVHDDGTVSMQALAETVNDDVVHTQQSHCAQLSVLYERLRKNWFILYDYKETEPSDEITTVSQWRISDENAWRISNDAIITGQRVKGKRREKQRKAEHLH